MKIKELLNDNNLYELGLLMTEVIWQTLVDNYSNNEVTEGYQVSQTHSEEKPARTLSRPTQRRPAPHTIKPFYPPKPASIAPKPVTKAPNPLTTGSNPTVDMMKAPNFKLNDRNIKPEFTELDKKIAGIKSTN